MAMSADLIWVIETKRNFSNLNEGEKWNQDFIMLRKVFPQWDGESSLNEERHKIKRFWLTSLRAVLYVHGDYILRYMSKYIKKKCLHIKDLQSFILDSWDKRGSLSKFQPLVLRGEVGKEREVECSLATFLIAEVIFCIRDLAKKEKLVGLEGVDAPSKEYRFIPQLIEIVESEKSGILADAASVGDFSGVFRNTAYILPSASYITLYDVVQGLLNGITIPQLKAAGMSLKEVREFKEGFKYLLSLRLDLSVVRHTVDVVNLLVENEV